MRYVAFVRGINVGGKAVKMAELRKMFGSLGFKGVSTFKASGNVVFESSESIASTTKKIESGLHKLIGKETRAILRSVDHLKEMVASEPFKGIKVTPETRLYVTFLQGMPSSKMKNYESPDGDFRFRVSDADIFSVLILSPKRGTVDLMGFIEKEFGKDVTTRNWNTVVGIAETKG